MEEKSARGLRSFSRTKVAKTFPGPKSPALCERMPDRVTAAAGRPAEPPAIIIDVSSRAAMFARLEFFNGRPFGGHKSAA